MLFKIVHFRCSYLTSMLHSQEQKGRCSMCDLDMPSPNLHRAYEWVHICYFSCGIKLVVANESIWKLKLEIQMKQLVTKINGLTVFKTGCLKNEIRNLPRTNEHSRHNFVRQHLEIVLFARTYAPQPDHRFVSHPRMNTFLSFDERRIYHFFFFLMFCTIQVYPDSIR